MTTEAHSRHTHAEAHTPPSRGYLMQRHGEGGKNAAMHGCEGGRKDTAQGDTCGQCTKTDARRTYTPQETLSQDPEPPAQHAGTHLVCPCTAAIRCCCCQSQQAPMQLLHTAVSQPLLVQQGRAELRGWLVHLPVYNCHSATQHLSNSARQKSLWAGHLLRRACPACLTNNLVATCQKFRATAQLCFISTAR